MMKRANDHTMCANEMSEIANAQGQADQPRTNVELAFGEQHDLA